MRKSIIRFIKFVVGCVVICCILWLAWQIIKVVFIATVGLLFAAIVFVVCAAIILLVIAGLGYLFGWWKEEEG